MLRYKSAVGGERTGRKARMFICSHYDTAAVNTDRSFPSKRPLGTGYLHINGRRWFIYSAQLGSAKATVGYTCRYANTPPCSAQRACGICCAAGGQRLRDHGWNFQGPGVILWMFRPFCSLVCFALWLWYTLAYEDLRALPQGKGWLLGKKSGKKDLCCVTRLVCYGGIGKEEFVCEEASVMYCCVLFIG